MVRSRRSSVRPDQPTNSIMAAALDDRYRDSLMLSARILGRFLLRASPKAPRAAQDGAMTVGDKRKNISKCDALHTLLIW
jgi:hypothetical protein